MNNQQYPFDFLSSPILFKRMAFLEEEVIIYKIKNDRSRKP
jgi:hypothetical protein